MTNLAKFRNWEDTVNRLMVMEYGVGLDDIPDMPTYSWFKNDMSPEEAVAEAIEMVNNNGWW